MTGFSQTKWAQYGFAALCVGLAILLRRLLDPFLGDAFPFATLFLAIVMSAWFGGAGPALLAVVLGAVASALFLLEPLGNIAIAAPVGRAGLVLYCVVGAAIVWLADSMARTRNAAKQQSIIHERVREEMRATLASIGDAVIVTDVQGQITLINPEAAALTGWSEEEARGQSVESVVRIVEEESRNTAENPALRAIQGKPNDGRPIPSLLIAKDGAERPIEHTVAPIRSMNGLIRGAVLVFRNVDQRRQTQRQLEASERRFRLLADAAPVLIWMSSADKRWNYVNRPWLDFTGRTLEQELGEGWTSSVHPADLQHCLTTYRGSIDARQPFRMEFRLRRAEGDYRWLLSTGVPLFDTAGGFTGYIGSCIDITERREFEDDLREQQEWLRVTLSSIGDAVIATDTEGRILFLNGVAESLTGYTESEVAQQPLESVFRVYNELTREPVENPALKALRERRVVLLANHTILVDRDGMERPIDDSAAPIEDDDGRLIGAVLIFRDVTERRRADEARRRLAAIVESSDDAIVGKTLDGIITSWNQGATRVYGYEPEEVIGRPFSILVPAERAQEVQDTAWTLSKGRRIEHFETLRRRKGGRLIDVSVSYSPIHDREGNLVGMSVITRDISQQRQAERCRNVRLAAAQILSQAMTLQEAAPRLLQAACEELRWKAGALWIFDAPQNVLRCVEFWSVAPADLEPFERATRTMAFDPNVSLPGRVWLARQPLWITDVTKDEQFLRRSDARLVGLHGGLACPVALEGDVLGVIEFFSSEVSEPDAEILETLSTVGVQVAQFVKRRRAEEDVRRSEQELADFFENATIGLHWAGPDGIIRRANHAELAMLGYTREEYVGRHMAEFHVDREVIDDIQSRLAAGDVISMREARLRHKDGTIRHVVMDASVLWEDGRFIHTRCFTRDITERKAAEIALQRAERMARFLADASAALAGLIDLDSTLQNVARLAVPAFADWCVIDLLEADGSVRRVAVAHLDRDKERLAREIHTKWPPKPDQGVHRIIRSGCSEILSEISDEMLEKMIDNPELLATVRQLGMRSFLGVPLMAHGKVSGVIEFISADSGRRFDAEDLSIAEDLAHRTAVAIENTRLYEAIRESDQRKDEFLAVLAHELRNPLAPVRNALSILRQPTATPDVIQRAREMAERQVQHLTRLVDDLLDVSRIMRGKIELRKARVDVATIVARAIETARPVIDAEKHELIVSLPPEPVVIEADEVRMAQVIFNLLSNAAKYTEPGGRIELSVTRDEAEVCFHIRDNGIGIAPDFLPRLFEIFVQVAPTAPRSQGGLGIGLTLVKNLVEMHGGAIDAYSAGLGQGSEFVVRLPVPTERQQTNAGPEPAEGLTGSSPTAGRRILVVDDNVDAANSLAMLLKLQGHNVRAVHSGSEALAAVDADPPQIVLLDIGMPLMDGFEVARRLRAGPHSDRLTLVAITGWGQTADRERTKAAGFDHHLTKPVEFAMLETVLNHHPSGLTTHPQIALPRSNE